MRALWAWTVLGGCMGMLGVLCVIGGCVVENDLRAESRWVDLLSVRGCTMERGEAEAEWKGLEIRLACPVATNEARIR